MTLKITKSNQCKHRSDGGDNRSGHGDTLEGGPALNSYGFHEAFSAKYWTRYALNGISILY